MHDNAPMGELHGRPDTPADEPEPPAAAPAPDRPRAPRPPSGDTTDPRAVWRTMRLSDAPEFAPDQRRPDPRVEVRYVTDLHAETGPSSPRPYRTATIHPRNPITPPDGPAHRPPDLIPPRGEDLPNLDAPGASRAADLRKALLESDNIENVQSALDEWSSPYESAFPAKPHVPPTAHTEVRPRQTMYETPHLGLDTGDVLTAMFVGGILLGETARVAYRKTSELKEIWHGRN